ncbi:MAG: TolA-binding protein, partial [Myxococcota bacterium]
RNRQRSDSGRYGNVAPAADQAPPGQVVYDAPAEPRPTRASQPMPKKGPVTLAKVAGTVQTKDQKKDQKKEESRRPGTVVAYDRAMDHYRQERYGKAITGFESYLKEAEGGQADAQARLAKSYARTNQVKQAAARYRKLLKDNPNYRSRSTVLIELARLESLMGNLAEARALLKQAAKDKSVATRAKQRLADIERRLKVQTKRAAAKKAKAKASKKAAPQKAAPAKADKPYEPAKK